MDYKTLKSNFYKVLPFLVLTGIAALIYFTSYYSYLVFHSFSEFFAILIMVGIFMVSWNARKFMKNNFFLFIGISYLFIGLFDLVHTFSYKGMGVFTEFDANLPTQLWISARYLQSVSFLAALFFIKRKLNSFFLILIYFSISFLIFSSIFFLRNFPDAFIEGQGLTQFKIVSEYIISFIFLSSIFLFVKNRKYFQKQTFLLITASLIFTIISELFFTFYTNVYGFFNLLGHISKIFAFYLIYKAVIEIGLAKPFNFLFHDLKIKEKELTEEKEKIEKYINLANVIFLVMDHDQKVMLINKKGCQILGRKKEEIIGKNWFDKFVPEKVKKGGKKYFIGLFRKRIKDYEYHESPILTKKEEVRIIGWHNTYIKDNGKTAAILASGEDITERKELEKRKDEFISIASHELKTPVTSIKAFAQILEKRLKGTRDKKNSYIISALNDQTDKLHDLIKDLLDVSKIEEGKLKFRKKTSDLNALIKKIIDDFSHTHDTHKIINKGKIVNKVLADQGRIEQVMVNLLNNAIKYSPNGKQVIVETKRKNGKAIVSVEDFGFGISKEDQTKIFERFYRTEEIEKNNLSGFGLGLYISNEIIKRHGGEMWVESTKGKGSKFFFSIPINPKLIDDRRRMTENR